MKNCDSIFVDTEELLSDMINDFTIEWRSGERMGMLDTYECSSCGASVHAKHYENTPPISELEHSDDCSYIRAQKLLASITKANNET